MRRVYFIKPIGMLGPIKIGCSSSPDNRRRTLACWSPFPLEIVAEIDGDIKLEQRFHTRFLADYISHEWFKWSAELQAVIDAVAAGAFDLASLPAPQQLPRVRNRIQRSAGWRYQRSVWSRCQHLSKRGLPWNEVVAVAPWRIVSELGTPEQLEAARAHVEPIIAAWTARFPPKSGRIRKPTQAAA